MLRFHITTIGHDHGMYFNRRHARCRNTIATARVFGGCPGRRRTSVPRLPLRSFTLRLSIERLACHVLVLLNSHHGWWGSHVGVPGRLIIPHADVLDLI
jgi:hypothetical protein